MLLILLLWRITVWTLMVMLVMLVLLWVWLLTVMIWLFVGSGRVVWWRWGFRRAGIISIIVPVASIMALAATLTIEQHSQPDSTKQQAHIHLLSIT